MDATQLEEAGRIPLPRLLEPFRRSIEATARPGVGLTPRAAPGAVVGSRYGGVPLVPWGTAWPQSPKRPMAFIGQLNFGQLARAGAGSLPGMPAAGVLAVFYDVDEQRWGFDPKDRDFWRVTYVPEVDQAVALVPPASVRDTLAPHGLVPSIRRTLPSPGDACQVHFPAGFARYLGRSYASLHASVGGASHQVLGHPSWLERDARAQAERASAGQYCGDWLAGPAAQRRAAEASEWRLLWQIASDEGVGMQWGAGGCLYLLIRESDLRARAFGRAWCVVQSP